MQVWSMYYTVVPPPPSLTSQGQEFFDRISGGGANPNQDREECFLTFHWNADFTEAEISGYYEELVGSQVGGWFLQCAVTPKIKLSPYWKWKFGMNHEQCELSDPELAAMDAKCCAATTSADCTGANTLGKGDACDTISTACKTPSENDVATCAMWRRSNLLMGLFECFAGFPGYNVYPIGDKNRAATGYFNHNIKQLNLISVGEIFHGK